MVATFLWLWKILMNSLGLVVPGISTFLEALIDWNILILVPGRRLLLDWLLPLLPAELQTMIYTFIPRELLRWSLWTSDREHLSEGELIYETPKVGVKTAVMPSIVKTLPSLYPKNQKPKTI
jgi:hypothetical protein